MKKGVDARRSCLTQSSGKERHRSALLSEIKTIIPNFDDFSAQSKLDTLIHGKNVSKSQQVVIAGLFQTYIARTRRFIPSH